MCSVWGPAEAETLACAECLGTTKWQSAAGRTLAPPAELPCARPAQLKDACTALLRHLKKKTEAAAASNLLGEDADPETIVVNFVLSKLPSSVRHKPVQV